MRGPVSARARSVTESCVAPPDRNAAQQATAARSTPSGQVGSPPAARCGGARTRVRDLSGGMKQKLLAALALASESLILVCDEPTASLDAQARAAFFELVDARAAETILVLCSHRADDVSQLVGRTVQLADGRSPPTRSGSGAFPRAQAAPPSTPCQRHGGSDETTCPCSVRTLAAGLRCGSAASG